MAWRAYVKKFNSSRGGRFGVGGSWHGELTLRSSTRPEVDVLGSVAANISLLWKFKEISGGKISSSTPALTILSP
jgi:hypothetical protein